MDQPPIFKQIIQTTGDLPTIPAVANLVMQKISDPDTSPQDLQQIISTDQALAARILKIGNSTFYGCSRNITRLSDAIVIIGFNSIRSLVMTSALRDLLKSFGLAEKLLWEHSLGCAFASRIIAKSIKFSKVEESFLAGLLHDIGKVVLNLKLPDKMSRIIQEVYGNPLKTFLESEQEMLGFDHAQIGQLVVKKWNFAEEIEEAIGNHHRPEKAKILPPLSFVVQLGNAFCHKLEIGPTKNPDLDIMELTATRLFKLDGKAVSRLLDETRETFDSQQSAFM